MTIAPRKWLAIIGLSATLLLVVACGQNTTSQQPQRTTVSSSVSPTGGDLASPSPSASALYATAQEAAIAGVAAKTGSSYRADGLCPSGQSCLSEAQVFGYADPKAGFNAAYVQMGYGGSGGGSACFAYVFYETSGWHLYPPVICGQQGGLNPILGYEDQIQVTGGGCANVRQRPSLSAKVVACLKNGTNVTIDASAPRYVDGHIWWSINHQQGFMAHDVLISQP
jgi:hypothetical protein